MSLDHGPTGTWVLVRFLGYGIDYDRDRCL